LIIVYIRELTKDLENLTGDFSLNYKTIPVVFGERACKYIITSCIMFSYLVIYILLNNYDTGVMYYYYYFSIVFLFLSKKDYGQLHLLLKFLIFFGVASIVLIDPNVFLERLNLLLN
jgi:4-hydroxybenzoate polyprenyltransferase